MHSIFWKLNLIHQKAILIPRTLLLFASSITTGCKELGVLDAM